jgi:hydroxypyruvate isomerase
MIETVLYRYMILNPDFQRMHPVRFCANLSLLFTDLPLLQRPAAAAAQGFTAVEIWWPFDNAEPSARSLNDFASAVQEAGVELVALNFFAGDMPAGDRGILSHPGREAEFQHSVALAAELAVPLGCRAFNALYGNRKPELSADDQDATAIDNLTAASATVGADAMILLEPISGAPLYPLRTVADVCKVIDAAQGLGNAHNLRVLCDLYHLSVNGDDIDAAIAAHADRIGHVQIADAPGRHEPGTGRLNIGGHLDHLQAVGYSGHVGLEYVPSDGDTVASLSWLPRPARGAGTVQQASAILPPSRI